MMVQVFSTFIEVIFVIVSPLILNNSLCKKINALIKNYPRDPIVDVFMFGNLVFPKTVFIDKEVVLQKMSWVF